MDNRPQLLGRGAFVRALYVAGVTELDEWPVKLAAPTPHFSVFLAMDATSVDAERIGALARKLINQGMVYLTAWGPDCKQVHDIFDAEREGLAQTDEAFLMTTWHADEDLEDALWDAAFAVPADDYLETCGAVLAIVVARRDWREEVEAAFRDFEAFSKRVVERAVPPRNADRPLP